MRRPANQARIQRFLEALARSLRRPLRLYLVGGTVLVHLGLREATLDIDYVVAADDPAAQDEFERMVPNLKERLNLNLEPASPADFMPVPPEVLDRSRYVGRYGQVEVYYYHLPTQVLAKTARFSERDISDVQRLIEAGLVTWGEVEAAWREVRAQKTGWLRVTPAELERRLRAMRARLKVPSIESESILVRPHQRGGRPVRGYKRLKGPLSGPGTDPTG